MNRKRARNVGGTLTDVGGLASPLRGRTGLTVAYPAPAPAVPAGSACASLSW